MMRGKVLHYVERDGDREVHIIPDVFQIAWDNFSIYEEMGDTDDE